MAGTPEPRREPGTLKVGSIAGIDVLVRASWLLVAALIAVTAAPALEQVEPGLGPWAYLAGLSLAVLLYLSVLLHEVSHALMARRYGMPVSSITLHFLGGVTAIDGESERPGQEFGISVVGPLASLAVGGVFLGVWQVAPEGLVGAAFAMLAFANLVVGVLNLVPGLPLDGGFVLRALVWRVTGNRHDGTVVAGRVGQVCAVLVLAYPLWQHVATADGLSVVDLVVAGVVAAFLWQGASTAIASAKIRRRLPALHARALTRPALLVPRDTPLAEVLRRVEEQQRGGVVVVDADGRPTAVASEAAVLATPEDRRPWVTIGELSRLVEPDLVLDVRLSGEPLVRAMQRADASEYLVLDESGAVVGVLVSADVDRAFAEGAGRARRGA